MKNNKRNIKIFASALSLVMSTSFVSGCNKLQNYEYIENSEGKMELEGEFSYTELITSGRVIEVSLFDKKELYIVRKSKTIGRYSTSNRTYYYNIFNNNLLLQLDYEGKVVGDTQIDIINESALSDYLIYYDEIKNTYDKEDLERILNKIKSDYVVPETKILLKERV